MKHKWYYILVAMFTMLSLAACAGNNNGAVEDEGNMEEQSEELVEAGGDAVQAVGDDNRKEKAGETMTVVLKNSEGKKVGTVRLIDTLSGVDMILKASHLPAGTHGFHIHETGKCLAPNFKSAGEHFNPTENAHGFDHPKGPHAGDLPNIHVGKDGMVQAEVIANLVTLEKGKENSLLDADGSAIVIHEKADDYKSQPSGAAGSRIVCGVIGGQ
jgi:Cu-Zn family superoxide dismutase